jgi:hypothetical protein
LVHQQSVVRGRASGADVELDYWVVVTFREAKIIRDEWFADRAGALEAAGLQEWLTGPMARRRQGGRVPGGRAAGN